MKAPEGEGDCEASGALRAPHTSQIPSHLVTLELSGTDKLDGLILLQHQLVLGLLRGRISSPKLQRCSPQPGLFPARLLVPWGT